MCVCVCKNILKNVFEKKIGVVAYPATRKIYTRAYK